MNSYRRGGGNGPYGKEKSLGKRRAHVQSKKPGKFIRSMLSELMIEIQNC